MDSDSCLVIIFQDNDRNYLDEWQCDKNSTFDFLFFKQMAIVAFIDYLKLEIYKKTL